MKKWAYFDCDDTLVLWNPQKGIRRVSVWESSTVVWELGVHQPHVAKLIEHSIKGDRVVVWSRAGVEWAKSVVFALDIAKHVHHILAKPDVVYDDEPSKTLLPAVEWLHPKI